MERPAKRLKSDDAGQVEAMTPAFAPASTLTGPSGPQPQEQELTDDEVRARCAEIFRQSRQQSNGPANALVDARLNRGFYGSQGPQSSSTQRTPSPGGETEPLTSEASIARANLTEVQTGPEIQFGNCASRPRWMTVPTTPFQSPGQANTFEWRFDTGPSYLWKGLTVEELAEYAYKYLEHALEDPVFRDLLRLEIRTGPYSHFLTAYVEDPLPPLPDAPPTNHFGRALGSPTIYNDERYFYYMHKSPFVALPPGPSRPQATYDDSPIVGGRRSTVSPKREVVEDEQGISETVRPKYNTAAQEQLSRLTSTGYLAGLTSDDHRRNATGPAMHYHANGLPNGRSNGRSNGPPNGLPRVDPSEIRQQARTKQVAKKSASILHKDPKVAVAQKMAPETEEMKLERQAMESLEDKRICEKTLPRHTFRRFRPWAGCKNSTKFINLQDLARLPRFPAAQRALSPRVNAIASAANAAKTAETAETSATSNSENSRRNPPRNRRKPRRFLD